MIHTTKRRPRLLVPCKLARIQVQVPDPGGPDGLSVGARVWPGPAPDSSSVGPSRDYETKLILCKLFLYKGMGDICGLIHRDRTLFRKWITPAPPADESDDP